MHGYGVRSDYQLRFNRPDDAALEAYHASALAFFKALGAMFPPVAEFLKSRRPSDVVARYRRADGGHLLFRSIGIDIVARTAIAISQRDGITTVAALGKLAKLPVMLDQAPFRGTIWDPVRKVVRAGNKALARRLLFYMLKLPMSDRQRHTLEGDYRAALGHERDDASVALPRPLA